MESEDDILHNTCSQGFTVIFMNENFREQCCRSEKNEAFKTLYYFTGRTIFWKTFLKIGFFYQKNDFIE